MLALDVQGPCLNGQLFSVRPKQVHLGHHCRISYIV